MKPSVIPNSWIIISVIIPTYNSERTLSICLESIKNQDFDQNKIEILIIDGWSNDETINIAKKYSTTIISNPKRLPEYAKIIGCNYASWKYIIFHDSDEKILNKLSFSNKVWVFEKYWDIWSVVSTWLVRPCEYSKWSDYTNLVWDPFSAFLYSWDPESYACRYTSQYRLKCKDKIVSTFTCTDKDIFPLIDGAWHIFLRAAAIDFLKLGSIWWLSSYNIRRTWVFGVTNNDPIEHYSSSSFLQILNKIRFRIISNVYGDSGAWYIQREEYIPRKILLRKYLFILYWFSLLFPLFRWFLWSIKTRNPIFLAEPIFAFYTAFTIMLHMIMKHFGYTLRNSKYW